MTGREIIANVASEIGVNASDAQKLASALDRIGYACVPKQPTELMLRNAWADATAENAEGVWSCMIQACEDPITAMESLK